MLNGLKLPIINQALHAYTLKSLAMHTYFTYPYKVQENEN